MTTRIDTNPTFFGVADPGRYIDLPGGAEPDSLYSKRLHGAIKTPGENIKFTIIIIIVSAILFITIVSIYDLIRNIMRRAVDRNTLSPDSDSGKAQQIVDTEILITNGIFTAFCIIFAAISLPLLIYLIIPE